jgi:hypothetical protein
VESICQCTRCKKKHLESERKNKPRSDGFGTDSVCPSCGCKSFYDLNELTISVKDNMQTFTARCLGKSASCTANAAHAAMNCAKKVYSDGEYTLTEKPDNRRGYQTFIAVLKGV